MATNGDRRQAQTALRTFLAELKAEHKAAKDDLEGYRETVKNALVRAVDGRARVEVRVKEWRSLERKLERGNYVTIKDVGDLIGARLIVLQTKEMRPLIEELTSDGRNPRSVLKRMDGIREIRWNDERGRASGYSSLHLPVTLRRVRRRQPVSSFELQVRTELQHTWAELAHDRFYKEAVPSAVLIRLRRFGAAVNLLDQELESLADSVEEERKGLRERLQRAVDLPGVGLDEFTLQYWADHVDGDKLRQLEDMAADQGFRRSGWPDLVRPGDETEIFTLLADKVAIGLLRDVQQLVDRVLSSAAAQRLLEALVAHVQAAVDESTADRRSNSWSPLFNRPLYVLSFLLLVCFPNYIELVYLDPAIKQGILVVAFNCEADRNALMATLFPAPGSDDPESSSHAH